MRPLGAAKIYFDFQDIQPFFTYNLHFKITILNGDDEEQTLPNYFDSSNDGITNKNTKLEIRIYNTG